MHQSLSNYDLRTAEEIEEILPDNSVPADLHFQDAPEEAAAPAATLAHEEFADWIHHGRHGCKIAQMLLHTWLETHRATHDDDVADFFDTLLAEHKQTSEDAAQATELPVAYLAPVLTVPGGRALALADKDVDPTALRAEVTRSIEEEVASVNVYVSHWKATGAVAAPAPRKVLEETTTRVRDYVYPWPRIEREPLRHDDDGRFVKSFPVEFPMGTGDLQQTRVRSDFSVADYVQHVMRYHTGHLLRSLRGQRVLYALFNTALREEGHKQGGLMHKNSHAVVLTKAQLEPLVHERDDLVGKLGSWGADIPTSSMH